jgi:hypothetical protein
VQVQAQLAVCKACGLFEGSTPEAYVCIINSSSKQPYGIWPVQLDEVQRGITEGRLRLWYGLNLLPTFKATVLQLPAAQQQELQWLLELPDQQQQPPPPLQQQQQQQQQVQSDNTPATPARPQQQVEQQQGQQQQGQGASLHTPSIKVGKPVTSQGKGPDTVGVVRSLRLGTNQAIVDWPGAARGKAVQMSSLGVCPLPRKVPRVPPTAADQQVVGVYGTHNQKRGTVTAMRGEKCVVKWDAGGESSVSTLHLHVLGTSVAEEVPATQVRQCCRVTGSRFLGTPGAATLQ